MCTPFSIIGCLGSRCRDFKEQALLLFVTVKVFLAHVQSSHFLTR